MAADWTNHTVAQGLNRSMSIRAPKSFFLIFLVVVVAALIVVPLHAPPDGQDRAELAQFIGRFHPLVVHLPIALLLLVPLFELCGITKRWSYLRTSAGFLLKLATLAVITAVTLGWLLAWSGGYDGPLVAQHMWGGVMLAIASVACCLVRRSNLKAYAAALFATLMLMIWTSDQGGKITHGETYLTEFMPASVRPFLKIRAPHKKTDVAGATVNPSVIATTSVSTPTNVVNAASAALASFFAARVQPIFEDKCVTCHNPNKHKANLRLDSFEHLMRGSKHGPVVKAGDPQHSELYRRITLSPEEKDFMPADGKPRLTANEIKVIELWLSAGASDTVPVTAVQGAPPLPSKPRRAPPLAPDYRPYLETIDALEASLGVRLVPRSQNPTDGLIVRTVSFPERCNDQTLARLQPVADLIVDAELSRTKITDAGLSTVAAFGNLRTLDLSHTPVTSAGVRALARLEKLVSLNLTATAVDDSGVAELRLKPRLKRLYLFETRCKQKIQ